MIQLDLNFQLIVLEKGEKSKLSLNIPSNSDKIEWNIEDKNIVELKDNYIRGLNPGITSIKVTDNNQFEYVFNVKVISFDKTNAITAPTGIGLSKASLSLNVGETSKINAVVFPENATQVVTWETNNMDVISVDSNGNIQALAKGKAIVTATTNNGISITCDVEVK